MSGDYAINARQILATALVSIWAARLSIYIFIRHKSEDYRYKKMREEWEKKGNCFYYTKAYFVVYILQGIFSLINNSSLLYINLYSDGHFFELRFTDIIGTIIWFIGFLIEVFSDR